MPKNPDGGQASPLDINPAPNESLAPPGERRGATAGTRGAGESRRGQASGETGGGAATPPEEMAGAPTTPQGRAIHERKKQFLIAPRQPQGLETLGFAPLSLSSVEQALRTSPDIEIVDTVGPRNAVGALADGTG